MTMLGDAEVRVTALSNTTRGHTRPLLAGAGLDGFVERRPRGT